MDVLLFTSSAPDASVGCFQFLVVVNKAASNTVSLYQVFMLTHVFIPLGRYLRGRLPQCLSIERWQNLASPNTYFGIRITLS